MRRRLESPPALQSREARQGQQLNKHTDGKDQKGIKEPLETRKAGSAAMANADSHVEDVGDDHKWIVECREKHGR